MKRATDWLSSSAVFDNSRTICAVERVPSPRGEALVVYSLGNLVSNQGYVYRQGRREPGVEVPLREPATRDGVWLRVAVELEGDRVSLGGVEAVPLWTHNNYWDQERRRATRADIRVLPHAEVADVALRGERRSAIEAVLGTALMIGGFLSSLVGFALKSRNDREVVDAETGERRFQERLTANGAASAEANTEEERPSFGRGRGGFGGGDYASPIIAHGRLYITLKSGLVHVLEAKPEFTLITTNDLTTDPSGFDATPAVSNGQLFLRSHGMLYCIEE